MKTEKIGKVLINYDNYKGSDAYNEGDDVEERILEVLKTGQNITEALLQDSRWPILYQLSPRRECIIEPMDIRKSDNVLEIGAGMGAVTGAIAKRCNSVECIELSKRCSLANAYRNQGYDNIQIVVGNFQDITFQHQYDVITLIGVLEYAQSYIRTENPYQDFLKKIYGLLKEGGRLYIAIENKLGLKYFAGCMEDHIGIPFAGIEGYSEKDRARTFTKSELTALILDAGFCSTYYYYPFPDYKLPREIFSDDFLPNESFVPELQNYDMDKISVFNERKAYQSLSGLEEIKTLSNSFLVEAIRES